jgi:hypothetical protein
MRALSKNLLLILPLLIVGCAGVITGLDSTGQRVTIDYTQGAVSDNYSLTYRGEYFEGKAVGVNQGTNVTTFVAPGGNIVQGFGTSGNGLFKATLIGDKGSILKCEMNYASSSGYTPSGGIGTCIHTDGTTIELVW